MKKYLAIPLAVLMLVSTSCSRQETIKPTKNVIFMLIDGCSTSALSLARWYKQYEGGCEENLALDPYICGIMRECHLNAPIVGSAGAMTTLMTGELVTSPNIGMYPKFSQSSMYPIDSARAYQPLCNLAEVLKLEKGKSIGTVVTTTFPHATPAATFAHAISRSQYNIIGENMASICDVCVAGGMKRMTDKVRSVLEAREVPLVIEDYEAYRALEGDRYWAILAHDDMSYDVERKEGEPSLAEMTDKAIKTLSGNPKGFFLMVEGSKVDFAAHANDSRGVISDILAFDEAVKIALDFAKKDGNTTVVITADHGTAGPSLGKSGYSHYSERGLADAFGMLPEYKMTSLAIAERLLDSPAKSMKDTVYKYTGIEITPEEEKELLSVCGKLEEDYMEVSNTENIQGTVGKIMAARVNVGYTSGNHTGEDVFYAVYNPFDQRPEGFITNVQMNGYLSLVSGLGKPVRDYTSKYYVKHTEVLEGLDYCLGKDEFNEATLKITLADGRKLKIISNTTLAEIDGESFFLDLPAVYVPKTRTFYLPADFLKRI